MSRQNRCEVTLSGATYHVTNLGNRNAAIFLDDRDRRRFNGLVYDACTKFQVEFLAGGQTGSDFHQVVTTPLANLSQYMQHFEGEYAKFWNWRHGQVGHLFQDRFGAVLIDNDLHLFTALWHVFDRPVQVGLALRPENWRWSTYAASIGLANRPGNLSLSWVDNLFPAESHAESQRLLRRCMETPRPVEAYLNLADPLMAAAVGAYVAQRQREAGRPTAYRKLTRPPLEALFQRGQSRSDFALAIEKTHDVYGYKLSEIAKFVDLRPAAISKIYCELRRRRNG